MKTIFFPTVIAISACLLAGCNKGESASTSAAKTEQPVQTSPQNIMRMDKPGPAPDPSNYKGKF